MERATQNIPQLQLSLSNSGAFLFCFSWGRGGGENVPRQASLLTGRKTITRQELTGSGALNIFTKRLENQVRGEQLGITTHKQQKSGALGGGVTEDSGCF